MKTSIRHKKKTKKKNQCLLPNNAASSYCIMDDKKTHTKKKKNILAFFQTYYNNWNLYYYVVINNWCSAISTPLVTKPGDSLISVDAPNFSAFFFPLSFLSLEIYTTVFDTNVWTLPVADVKPNKFFVFIANAIN